MGDFIFPGIDWISHSSIGLGEKFWKVVDDCFLTQHVLWGTRDGNTLDLVLSSEPH